MEVDSRPAASGYMEVFILVGLAVGGSGIVYGAAGRYSASLQGPSVAVSGASIAQGEYFALERLTVYNTGKTSVSSFTVTTVLAPQSASFCYTLADPATHAVVASTCPSMATNPRTLAVSYGLAPGAAVTVTLEVAGAPFTVGSTTMVTVITSGGAGASLDVQVLPA